MGKASKYSVNNDPSISDLLFGFKDGKEQNVPIEAIINILNSVAGKDYIQYKFSPTDYASIGSFTTNISKVNPAEITKLFLNKQSTSKEDLTVLFTKLDTLQNIALSLRNPSDSNNFVTFKVTNITTHIDYFEFDVVVFKGFYSGNLLSASSYSLYFDVKENFEDKADKFIKSNESLSLAQRKGDVLYGILDQYTGDEITLSKVTGTPTVDNIIYFQVGTEYFKRNFTEVNVKWFGAKGDGVTDDTISIQNAISSLRGDTLIFPSSSGNYLISNTLTLNLVYTNASNTIIMASGGTQQTCFRLSPTFGINTPVILAENIAVGYNLIGLVITNADATKRGVGIKMVNCRKFVIERPTFLYLKKNLSYGIDCYYNSIKDFEFYRGEYGIAIETGYPIGSLKGINGKITECDYGVYSDGNCNDVVFSSTILEGCAYPVFVNNGTLDFTNCYLGDHSITPIVVNGGKVLIDSPTQMIGSALSVEYSTNDDTVERQGVLITGGELTIINATIGGNFIDSSGESSRCIGNSIKITGGKLIGKALRYGNAEASTIKRTSFKNTYLETFKNYVHNGCFKDEDISMIEKNIDSSGYTIDADLEVLAEDNGYGGKVIRMKPSSLLGKNLGFEIPYLIDDISEVKFIRMKFRSYKNFTEAESTVIASKMAIAVQIVGSTQFSNEDAITNGYIMTAVTNQSWPGYYILKKITSTNSYNKDYIQEVVFPVILTSKKAKIRITSLLQNLTSTIGNPDYLDCGIDIFYIALVDKIAGDLICDFTDSFFIPKEYTVSTLPIGKLGDTACVTDATAPTYLGALTGGGAVVCQVFYNGTAWVSC